MGSAADLNYSEEIAKIAEEVGYWIAKNNAVLVFGAEKDFDSLSTAACRGAKKAGGMTLGITYGRGFDIFEKDNVDAVVVTGLERGGGREMALVFSCDAIITISGGSGTLTEIAIAYQANIPVVSLVGSGGWSDKVVNTHLDDRKRLLVEPATTPQEAVEKAMKLIVDKK